MSPTQRSLAWLKKLGVPAGVVERWIPQIKRRIDLFNFIDLVAIVPSVGFETGHILALQVTSGSNSASRVTKILAEPRAKQWLEAGGRIAVHSWAKKGPAGKRKTWTLRSVPVTLADFGESPKPSETDRTEVGPDPDFASDTSGE